MRPLVHRQPLVTGRAPCKDFSLFNIGVFGRRVKVFDDPIGTVLFLRTERGIREMPG